MLETLKLYLEEIKKSDLFTKDLYLCSCFAIEDVWQLDFYSKKTKTITSFTVKNKKVEIIDKDSKIFQKEKKDLEKLDLEEFTLSLEEALKLAEQTKHKLCPDTTNKKIIIIQKIKVPLWNITFITNTLKIVNIKIDAITKEILHESCESVMSFKKQNTK